MRDTASVHDAEGSTPTDHRYAGFELGERFVVYDTECEGAWVQSDVTLDPAEVA